jgi:hypothetical protein
VIAVPLWMLAHITLEGEGLHGRATEGYSLLFNVLFRPVLMLFGLFLGYFVFAAMAFLINNTFGVLAGEVLAGGGLITNLLGVAVLLSIYVMAHVIAALTSFRMIAAVPHHLPRYIGFMAANRVDMDEFSRDAALVGVGGTMSIIRRGLADGASQSVAPRQVTSTATRLLPAPLASAVGSARSSTIAHAGMDSTLRASTDVGANAEEA